MYVKRISYISTFSSYFDELWHRRKNHPTPQKSRQLKRIGSHNFIQKMQNCGEISNLQILVWHIRFKALSCPSKSHSFNEGEKNIPALGEGRCKSRPRTVIMRMVLLHKLIFSNDFLYVRKYTFLKFSYSESWVPFIKESLNSTCRGRLPSNSKFRKLFF